MSIATKLDHSAAAVVIQNDTVNIKLARLQVVLWC